MLSAVLSGETQACAVLSAVLSGETQACAGLSAILSGETRAWAVLPTVQLVFISFLKKPFLATALAMALAMWLLNVMERSRVTLG